MYQQLRCHLILIGALFFQAHFLSAQSAQVDFRELIVQIPGITSSRGFPEIKNKLHTVQGVHVVAWCETEQLIMMKIEKKKQADNRPVFTAISEMEFKFHVKEGATISKAINSCRDKKTTIFKVDDLPSE